ncbi:MAG: hypothetical protein U0105_00930 [Candidatus Obscuribacterales bacterium]
MPSKSATNPTIAQFLIGLSVSLIPQLREWRQYSSLFPHFLLEFCQLGIYCRFPNPVLFCEPGFRFGFLSSLLFRAFSFFLDPALFLLSFQLILLFRAFRAVVVINLFVSLEEGKAISALQDRLVLIPEREDPHDLDAIVDIAFMERGFVIAFCAKAPHLLAEHAPLYVVVVSPEDEHSVAPSGSLLGDLPALGIYYVRRKTIKTTVLALHLFLLRRSFLD